MGNRQQAFRAGIVSLAKITGHSGIAGRCSESEAFYLLSMTPVYLPEDSIP